MSSVIQTNSISKGFHDPYHLQVHNPCQTAKSLEGLYRYGQDVPSSHNCNNAPIHREKQASDAEGQLELDPIL